MTPPSILVSPLHDPQGLLLPQLSVVVAQLKEVFTGAILGVTPMTKVTNRKLLQQLAQDQFFTFVECRLGAQVGEDLCQIYAHAVGSQSPETMLHLCFVDRVIFALRSHYLAPFAADMRSLQAAETPVIFQRSQVAWATHPQNYQEVEAMATRTGQLLFGKSWDFAWCHLALPASQLQTILPRVREKNFSVCAEMVLLLRQTLQTRDVDWLAWEDPLLFNRDAAELKREREESVGEVQKRFSYVLPMMEVIHAVSALGDR